jgi:hypothetical protein
VEPCTRHQCTHGVEHVLTSCIVALNTCTTMFPTKYAFLQTKAITYRHHHKNRIQSHSIPFGHTVKIQVCARPDCKHFLSGLSQILPKILLNVIEFHASYTYVSQIFTLFSGSGQRKHVV